MKQKQFLIISALTYFFLIESNFILATKHYNFFSDTKIDHNKYAWLTMINPTTKQRSVTHI